VTILRLSHHVFTKSAANNHLADAARTRLTIPHSSIAPSTTARSKPAPRTLLTPAVRFVNYLIKLFAHLPM
jgi:hypothetical protein